MKGGSPLTSSQPDQTKTEAFVAACSGLWVVLLLHLNQSCTAVRRHDLYILKLPGRDTNRYNDRLCDQALGLP